MSLPCPVPTCTRTMPGNLTVCRACSTGLLRDLTDVPSLDLHLDLALTRQAKLGTSGGRAEASDEIDPEIGLTLRRTPLPWDQRAREARDVLRSALVGWVRVLLADDERPGPTCQACDHPSCVWIAASRTPADTLPALARWLIRQRRALLAHPAVEEAVDELADAVRQARRAIDRPADRVYAGPCNQCGQDLLASPGARAVTCRTCELEYDIHGRQKWMREHIKDQLAHSTAMSGMLHQLGVDVPASTIRYWGQGRRLPSRGTDQRGRPLYRVGDVLELNAQRLARSAHHQ
ncbi:hypothetical protein ABT340_35900 [Streptosporangium sp. NPDC000239]|uniref:hypothetical protein n=1 Tax=Streptosporangium sp. NPDC000239 TaxID=3154248 RepID=UPI00333280B1